ncbi:histidine kinase [Paramesorhizobium deserti]|uniref:Blue-light-activated histidine kinase n=1 Tax=Paramesorhizobium deserti TaxID=1494590 RepID=A0A135HNM0_9HYPH|nr:PAS domain S-box protein [Paramesorhizobium deserti]KXF74736.1 histidine kinase [Paramesorhizobium deserti]
MSNVEEFPNASRRLTEYDAFVAAAPTLLEAIPGAVYVCDHDGWLVRFNKEASKLWGRVPAVDGAKDRFCGSHRLFRLDGTPLSPDECPMAEAVRAGVATHNAEVVMERPDGSRIIALVNIRPLRDHRGQIQGAVNCFQDISERKALEGEVRSKAADLEDFFENSAIGLHIVSGEGIILRANKAELSLLGYDADDYVGRHIAEFHADAPVIGDILHRLSCGERLDRYPARLRARDGSIKHVLITSNSRFSDGKFVNTRCFTTDVTSVHEAETARRESEERLAATYEAATIGIAEADAEGRLLRVNDAVCKMLGRSREELLNMTFFDYTHVDDRQHDSALYAQQIRGEISHYSMRKRAVRPDGTLRYLDVSGSCVRDASGQFRYGVRVIQDVTEAKRMEDKILRSERQMRELLEALPAAVYTTDAEGRITFFNQAAVDMAGRTPRPGDKWCVTWRLYNADGTPLPHDQCPMAVALKENRPVRGIEAVAERPDGTRVPFIPYPTPLRDADGRLVGAINMLVDVTEQKKAEEYAGRLAAIVEFSDDAIVSKDAQGVIQTWNAGAERLFGYEAAEVIGKPVNILIPPDRQEEEPEILDRIRRGDRVVPYETVRMRKDGSLIDVSLTVSPLKDGRGKVIGASKIARDITAKRRHEERRQLLVNELNHRVKNTLAMVQSLASQSFRGEAHSPAFQQFESRLIALSRAHDVLTREDWEGIQLDELIVHTIAPICVRPEERVRVSGPVLRLRPKLALSLSMAFHELCTNAAKYGALSNDTGCIEIDWQAVGADGTRRLQLRWEEFGGPEVQLPTRKGFGSRLLERALHREFDAQVALSFAPSGVVCEIAMPLT